MIALLASQALAQTLEERTSSVVQKGQNQLVETHVSFEAEWHELSNLDFRALDETSDQAILDSDDRASFAYTGVSLDVGYEPDESVQLVVGASHQGLWGNDQIGTVNPFGGFLYANALYVDLRTRGTWGPTFRIGRQGMDLGGVPSSLEFVLSDIVDQVRIDQPLGNVGWVRLIPVNVAAIGAQEDAAFLSFVGQAEIETFGFRGDRLTRRHGGEIGLDGLPIPVDLFVYGFYTDVGALGSGSDITYNGLLGNFADNDWVANMGLRGAAELGPVRPFLSVDGSMGVDRKELVAHDVDTNGYAVMLGTELRTGDEAAAEDRGLRAQVAGFQALGPAYGTDGMQFSHGYVGMKGRHAGGLLASRYLGWHPTAYVDMFGVVDEPHEPDRKSGTRLVQARLGYDFGSFDARAGWWFFQDTGVTELDLGDLDTLTPPFGYAREAFAAEERMGKVIGQEIDVDLRWAASEHVDVMASGAMFLPGAYYRVEVARVAGDALGSADAATPMGIYGGTRVRF